MNIVVTTPTGHIGSRIVDLLIQAGVRPTLIVRDPARLAPKVRAASDVRTGNLADRDFVLEATQGADALFWLIPTDYTSEDPKGDMLNLAHNAAAAIEKNGIGRVVFLSSMGAERPDAGFISALGQAEGILNETGANITHLRPGYFFTNLFMSLDELKQGVFPTTVPLDFKAPWIDPRDIGDVAAARLLSTAWTGQSILPIQGPADLSFAEVAAIVTESTGHPVNAILATDEETRQALLGAGMPAAVAEGFVEMASGISKGMERHPELAATGPTPLAAWVYAHLRPALG
ncbi:MAG: NAD(P)H-binding protein [Fimbriimonas sp.]